MDNLVPILSRPELVEGAPANPTFADAYRSARVIIDRSGPKEEEPEEPTTPTA